MIKLLSTISLALFMSPMAQPPVPTHNEANFRCMVATLYHEARGEGVAGIEAVASVIMNRAKQSRKSVCSIVYERKQFSWTHVTKDRRIKGNIMDILSITHKALSGVLVDVTQGATFYHATYVKPSWAKHKVLTVQINKHIFYKDKHE
jgi:N-acetylmuramoyl-L-alanine amidase